MTDEIIIDAILAEFLAALGPVRISVLSIKLNTSSKRIHTAVSNCYDKVRLCDVDVPIIERNYGTVTGYRRSPAVKPRPEWLGALLKREQMRAGNDCV